MIRIEGAREGNLKDISLSIPKNRLVVFTGLSGSGKSTLLMDVLFTECQRLYLEAMGMQGIRKPDVTRITGASPAVLIPQSPAANLNPRSTVGTVSDLYTELRMLFEKLGVRACPECGVPFSSADCAEETQGSGEDFFVWQYCCHCGKKLAKLTRSHFSFNTEKGACPVCQGLGTVHDIRREAVVDESLSLAEGAVKYWEKQYGAWQISVLEKAFSHYGLPFSADVPVREFTGLQKAILLEGADCEAARSAFPDILPPKTSAAGRFEGAFPILRRRLAEKAEKGQNAAALDAWFETRICPACGGERLAPESRAVTVSGMRLPQLSLFSLRRLLEWIDGLEEDLPDRHRELVESCLTDLKTKLNRLIRTGLEYLSLDRKTGTLSGGELQRMRLAAVLDSRLSGVIYILDEPTAGLHPRDTQGLIRILKQLRDLGNSVLVIEHDPDVMAAADFIVDLGPGAGKQGGEVVVAGSPDEILISPASLTGRWLNGAHPARTVFRKPSGELRILHASRYNLQDLSVSIPTGCLVSVTGPSGSGKTTLVFDVLAAAASEPSRIPGLERFSRIVEVSQSSSPRTKRSNPATWSGAWDRIRALFASTKDAKQRKLTARDFSFNSPGGRCETCAGLGYVDNNLLFFANAQAVCPVCHGRRFHEDVLSVSLRGLSILDVLRLSAEEAAGFFEDDPELARILGLLKDVGLGYLELGQPLTTLSGGEFQRLRLAGELLKGRTGEQNLYLLDEPTAGLHPVDVEHFLTLLDRLVDAGNSVLAVEHNRQVVEHSDWIIDLGPGGGDQGGRLMFSGTPAEFKVHFG